MGRFCCRLRTIERDARSGPPRPLNPTKPGATLPVAGTPRPSCVFTGSHPPNYEGPIAGHSLRVMREMADRPVSIDEVRKLAASLPRSYEALVRDRVKFRVGRIVYLAFSRDETLMGFAFPKDERDSLVASEPDKFLLPKQSDMRYNWVVVRLDAIDLAEMREIVIDAWRMVVPKFLAEAF